MFFSQLRDYWYNETLKAPIVSEDDTLAELILPNEANNRLCFFSVPFDQLSYYKKYIFPIINKYGLVPISADEIITHKENWIAKVSALIEKSEFFIVDLLSSNTVFELGLAISVRKGTQKILIINEEGAILPSSFSGMLYLKRSKNPFDEPEALAKRISEWFANLIEPLRAQYQDESRRLLDKGEYRAATIAAITLLENHLRVCLTIMTLLFLNHFFLAIYIA
ncbi:hypothetical protein [Hymenobacter bucti]|uniref:Uncharacterized protein n=1 Tax=Hymenobacter bucti TaxID=1844114 RepID=A0ABW4R109_9BACT